MSQGGGHQPVDLGRLDTIVGPLVDHAGEIALQRFRTALVADDKGGGRGSTRSPRRTS